MAAFWYPNHSLLLVVYPEIHLLPHLHAKLQGLRLQNLTKSSNLNHLSPRLNEPLVLVSTVTMTLPGKHTSFLTSFLFLFFLYLTFIIKILLYIEAITLAYITYSAALTIIWNSKLISPLSSYLVHIKMGLKHFDLNLIGLTNCYLRPSLQETSKVWTGLIFNLKKKIN